MGEEHPRADLLRNAAQIGVIPGGQGIAEQAWSFMIAVPAQSETVTIGRDDGLLGREALLNKGIAWREQQPLDQQVGSRIGQPTAHGARSPFSRKDARSAPGVWR